MCNVVARTPGAGGTPKLVLKGGNWDAEVVDILRASHLGPLPEQRGRMYPGTEKEGREMGVMRQTEFSQNWG